MAACLGVMLFNMAGMAMRAVGVMSRLPVVAGFMMLGGFTVVFGGMFVVLGGLVVMFDCVVAHVSSRSK